MRKRVRSAALIGIFGLPLLLCAGLLLAAPQRYITIVFEAEQATGLAKTIFVVEKVTQDASGKISGNKVLAIPKTPQGTKIPRDEVTYKVKIPATGTYYLWTRTFWTTGCGNSVFMKVEGYDSGKWIIGGDGSYDFMHWVCLSDGDNSSNPRPLKLKQGTVTFTLGAREGGVRIDQFLLTTDRKKRPADIYTPTKDALVLPPPPKGK
ncbi:MAG: hypothetical protein ACYC7E_14480 [Armatimonadota bacterium]